MVGKASRSSCHQSSGGGCILILAAIDVYVRANSHASLPMPSCPPRRSNGAPVGPHSQPRPLHATNAGQVLLKIYASVGGWVQWIASAAQNCPPWHCSAVRTMATSNATLLNYTIYKHFGSPRSASRDRRQKYFIQQNAVLGIEERLIEVWAIYMDQLPSHPNKYRHSTSRPITATVYGEARAKRQSVSWPNSC